MPRRKVVESVQVANATDVAAPLQILPLFPNIGQDPALTCDHYLISRVEPNEGFLEKAENPEAITLASLALKWGGHKLEVVPCNQYGAPMAPPKYLTIADPPKQKNSVGGTQAGIREAELERRLVVERQIQVEQAQRAKEERMQAREERNAELELRKLEMQERLKAAQEESRIRVAEAETRARLDMERERQRNEAAIAAERERSDRQVTAERERADRAAREAKEAAQFMLTQAQQFMSAQQANSKELTATIISVLSNKSDPVAAMLQGMQVAAQLGGGDPDKELVKEGFKAIGGLVGVAQDENKQLPAGQQPSQPQRSAPSARMPVRKNPAPVPKDATPSPTTSKKLAEKTPEEKQRMFAKMIEVAEAMESVGKDPEEVLDGLLSRKLGIHEVAELPEGETASGDEQADEESPIARRRRKRQAAERAEMGGNGRAHGGGSNGSAVGDDPQMDRTPTPPSVAGGGDPDV